MGSTATIVTMEFRKRGVDIPRGIAAALLSAIMTDTVILKSPTATEDDREQVAHLASILGVDATEFGLAVFKCRGGEDDVPVDKLVGADAKEFQLGDATVLIAQHETVDLESVLTREAEIRDHMRALKEAHGYEFVLLMITDILAEGSQFFCEGNRRVVNRVFGINCTGEGGTWMPGILVPQEAGGRAHPGRVGRRAAPVRRFLQPRRRACGRVPRSRQDHGVRAPSRCRRRGTQEAERRTEKKEEEGR